MRYLLQEAFRFIFSLILLTQFDFVSSDCGYARLASTLNCDCDLSFQSTCSLQRDYQSIPQMQGATAFGLSFWFKSTNELTSDTPFFLASITDSPNSYLNDQQWVQITNIYSDTSSIGQHQQFYVYTEQAKLDNIMSQSQFVTQEGTVLNTAKWSYFYTEIDITKGYSAFFITDFDQTYIYAPRTLITSYMMGLSGVTTIMIGSMSAAPFNSACGNFRDVTFVWMSLKQNPLATFAFLYGASELAHYQFDQVPLPADQITDYSSSNNPIIVTDTPSSELPTFNKDFEMNGLYFSGSDSLNLNIGYHSPSQNYEASVSYSFWIMPESQLYNPSTIFKRANSANANPSIFLTFDTINSALTLQIASLTFHSAVPITKNVWTRVIISVNNYQIVIRAGDTIYTNDIKLPYIEWYSGNPSDPLDFTETLGDPINGFKGYIREFRVFEGSSFTNYGNDSQFQYCNPTCTYFFGDYTNMICLQESSLSCPSTTVVQKSTHMCLNCNSACKSCSGVLPTNCLSCEPQYQLFNGQCLVQCTSNQYNSNGVCLPRTYVYLSIVQGAANSSSFTLTFIPKPSHFLTKPLENYVQVFANGTLYTSWTLNNITNSNSSNTEIYSLHVDVRCFETGTCNYRRRRLGEGASGVNLQITLNLANIDPQSQIRVENTSTLEFYVSTSSASGTNDIIEVNTARINAMVQVMNACVGFLFFSGVLLMILSKGKNATLYHYLSIASMVHLFKYFDVGYPSELSIFFKESSGETFNFPNVFKAMASPSDTLLGNITVNSSDTMTAYETSFNYFENYGSVLTLILLPLPIWVIVVIIVKKELIKAENASKKLMEKLEETRLVFEYNWFISLLLGFSSRFMLSLALQWKQKSFGDAYSVFGLIFSILTLFLYCGLVYIQVRAYLATIGKRPWNRLLPHKYQTLIGDYRYSRPAQAIHLALMTRNILVTMLIVCPNGDSLVQIIGAILINVPYTIYICHTNIYWHKYRGKFIKAMEVTINFLFIFPIVFRSNSRNNFMDSTQADGVGWIFLSMIFLVVVLLGIGHSWAALHHFNRVCNKRCKKDKPLSDLSEIELVDDSSEQSLPKNYGSKYVKHDDASPTNNNGDREIEISTKKSNGVRYKKQRKKSHFEENPIREQVNEEEIGYEEEKDESHSPKRGKNTPGAADSFLMKSIGNSMNFSFSAVLDGNDQGDTSLVLLRNKSRLNSNKSGGSNEEKYNHAASRDSSAIDISGFGDQSHRDSASNSPSPKRKNSNARWRMNDPDNEDGFHRQILDIEEEKSFEISTTQANQNLEINAVDVSIENGSNTNRTTDNKPQESSPKHEQNTTEEKESPTLLIKKLLKGLRNNQTEEGVPVIKLSQKLDYSDSHRSTTEHATPGASFRSDVKLVVDAGDISDDGKSSHSQNDVDDADGEKHDIQETDLDKITASDIALDNGTKTSDITKKPFKERKFFTKGGNKSPALETSFGPKTNQDPGLTEEHDFETGIFPAHKEGEENGKKSLFASAKTEMPAMNKPEETPDSTEEVIPEKKLVGRKWEAVKRRNFGKVQIEDDEDP